MQNRAIVDSLSVNFLKTSCRYIYIVTGLVISLCNVQANDIPEAAIAKLVGEARRIDTKQSATRLRRTYKSSIRDAEDLIKKQPTAGNRFEVLHLMMKLQRRLLALDRSDRTRTDLFDTCTLLAEAPDEYAELRFDADMLLSDKDLSAKDATIKERALALHGLVDRYRDTPAELKSLMSAMMLADQLHDMEGKRHYFKMIQQRFADDSRGIAFIRKHIGLQRMDTVFSGKFERNDGTATHFPYDRMGHAVIAVFWSKNDVGHKTLLSELKVQQDEQPGRFEIFSFNLDELDDAGASVLKSVGLQCSAMKLPGGMNSETFRTYVLRSPRFLLINEYGRTISEAEQSDQDLDGHGRPKEKKPFAYPKQMPSHGRIQMQLRSLLNGDFFVQDSKNVPLDKLSLPTNIIGDIQSSIPNAPFRYRLLPNEAHDSYSKLEKLCSSAITKHADAPELWRVQNHRIIALMGLWNGTGDPKYLKKAVAQSRALLDKKIPEEAVVVAQYCLARNALRDGNLTKKTIIETFVSECGGVAENDQVAAAASVLALNANAVHLHEQYREIFLKSGNESPYAVLSFLRNRYHRYYLFQGDTSYLNLDRRYKHRERRYMINNDITVPDTSFPSTAFKTLDGSTMTFPVKGGDKMTVVVFVEPPAGGSLDLSPGIYKLPPVIKPEPETETTTKKGKKKKKKKRPRPNPTPSGLLYEITKLAGAHVNKSVDVILAFLSDDVEQVKALNDTYKFPCRVVSVPSGLGSSTVRSLDIFSADETPNLFFVRPDGTIPWSTTGFRYRVQPEALGYQAYLSLRNHIFRTDMEAGYEALKSKDFAKAKTIFTGPYIVQTDLKKLENWRQSGGRSEYHKWTTTQHYGKALAHVALEEWEEALKHIEEAKIHHMVYFRHDEDKPNATGINLHKIHALIFDKLGRASEARAMRSKAAVEPTDYPTDYFKFTGYDRPYEVFNKKMSDLKIGQKEQ